MEYRNLSNHEIEQLEQQMCTCDEWSNVFVSPDFNPACISNSHFSGVVRIGSQTEKIKLYGGIKRKAGIYNSTIHNCGIGNNCYINFVKNHISNYNIGNNVIINNVELIANEGESTFGNGSHISVLDESGGRQIMIYDGLSAQLAYIMTLYRHRPNLIKRLEEIISNYASKKSYARGSIDDYCTISNTGTIQNMRIESHVTIDGCKMLRNGTIVSNEHAPVFIGNNVIIKDSIILSGSEIKEGVILMHCFIGQGCELGKNYSAENSVFFANCQGFHGEACSIFAGPFTVTHHKSTLLIAGMYSFLNAGSGSNQSNHMYKLGPIHQGIVERGSKTTSDSYLLWPAKIGPFTLVMGRHYKNSDTSDMPFSYLIERDDKTWLAPAVNLRSVGTIRDAMKWPKRDNRKDPHKIDSINFNLLSPYTIQKMVKAISILNNLKEVSGEGSSEYIFNNTSISSNSLHRGIKLYNTGIDKFLGNSIITRLKDFEYNSIEEIRNRLKPETEVGKGDWLDLSGLIAPKNEIVKILDEIENGTLNELSDIQNRFISIHQSYYDIEWTWSASLLEWRVGKCIDEIKLPDIISVIEQWKKSVLELDQMLYNDAKKEFQLSSMTGFGADGDKKTQIADFEMVRGKFENNSLVKEIQLHMQRKSELGDLMIAKFKQCCTERNQ
jgi:carbonic anhydrase/acetyltransferase-like protein (isoleucine patch superfamily)